METKRTIRYGVNEDGSLDVRVPQFAGVAGEHNATKLVFAGNTDGFYDGLSLVRILFGGADGAQVSSDLLEVQVGAEEWRVAYVLPQTVTASGGQITARLVLSVIENGKETQTAMSGAATLYFDDGTATEHGTPFWTGVSQMLKGTVDAAGRAQRYSAEAASFATGSRIHSEIAEKAAAAAQRSEQEASGYVAHVEEMTGYAQSASFAATESATRSIASADRAESSEAAAEQSEQHAWECAQVADGFAARAQKAAEEAAAYTVRAEEAALFNVVPDYWKGALSQGAKAINTALCTAGANKSAFLFYTDAHWNCGSQMAPSLLRYLHEHTGMTKTFFGGDIVNAEGDDYETMSYLWAWRRQLKGIPHHHSAVGNHDDGNQKNNRFSEQYVYGYLLAAEETPDMVRGKGLYYYIDNPAEKTRYLFLDTAFKAGEQAQQEFVKEALIGTPDKWHVVAVAHIWHDAVYTTSPPSVGDINPNASAMLAMFDNYNSRIGEFAACGGWVEFCIGGHTHCDHDSTSETGIPIILVETDSADVRNGRTDAPYCYAAGTATESSVNGIIADYDNHKIYVVRVGRGESREIAVTNYVVEYTNQIPISTDVSGAVYNGIGYKDGIRIGSDGADRTGSATDATGFIPCTSSDTLYFKNCRIAVLGGTSSTYQAIVCYDSNKAYVGCRYVDMATQMSGKDYSVDGDGCLTRYHCADLWANTAFVRITGNYIGAESVITVNEPIE